MNYNSNRVEPHPLNVNFVLSRIVIDQDYYHKDDPVKEEEAADEEDLRIPLHHILDVIVLISEIQEEERFH